MTTFLLHYLDFVHFYQETQQLSVAGSILLGVCAKLHPLIYQLRISCSNTLQPVETP